VALRGDGLDDGPELIGAREPSRAGGADGVDVESDASGIPCRT